MDTKSIPTGWQELFVTTQDAPVIDAVITLLKSSYPPTQYDNIDVRKLMLKMVPRENRHNRWIAGVRVFARPGNGPQDRICAIFFLRLKKQNLPVAYMFTAGAHPSVDQVELYRELTAICDYVNQSAGPNPGHDVERLHVVSRTATPPMIHSNLQWAFNRAVTDGKLANPATIPDSGPEWPRNLNSWTIKP